MNEARDPTSEQKAAGPERRTGLSEPAFRRLPARPQATQNISLQRNRAEGDCHWRQSSRPQRFLEPNCCQSGCHCT